MPGGNHLGLTVHFDKAVPDALEQWLGTEARYIIGSFEKPYDLEKVYGVRTNAVIEECKRSGGKVVASVSLILDAGMKKLEAAFVSLCNGDSFILDEKYKLLQNEERKAIAQALLAEDGPRVVVVKTK